MRAMKPGTTTVNNEMLPQGKARPTLKTRNGMQFPHRPPSGNHLPEWTLRAGCSFRFGPLPESASLSEGSKWDALSETRALGKPGPGMDAQGGMQFPREARCGKCVPESAFKTGHTFRNMVLREAASRSEPEFWDRLPLQTEEGALPAVDADGAPSLLDYVEAGS